jgi:hypothetical protein
MRLALVAVSLATSSCGSSSSPSATATTATAAAPAGPPAVGKSIRMRAGATDLIVRVSRVIFPLRDSGALLGPGDRAAGVDLSVRNLGHGVYDSSSESDVGLRTSAKELAEPAFASRGSCVTSEVDFLKEVQPGELRSGCVAFDVPKGARPMVVRFAPEGDTARGRSWLVSR